jgi:ATP-dependent helicase/nuclease subunit A
MGEKKINWTEQQKRAITEHARDVVVTASAGTGKTAVLSASCVDVVSNRSACPDVWSVLVLTFTNMAAEEMRSRIAEQLKTVLLRTDDSAARRHLRSQLLLLNGADIGTIHSFCKRLITEYFHKLALDPAFGVIESDEAALLKSQALQKTIDWAWQQEHLAQGLRRLLDRRDLRENDGFLAGIIAVSDFLDGIASRDNWYKRAAALAASANPFSGDLGEKQKQVIISRLSDIIEQIGLAMKLYAAQNTAGKWAMKWQDTFVDPLTKYIKLLQAGDWNGFVKAIGNFEKPASFAYKPRDLDGPIADIITKTAKQAKQCFDELTQLTILNPEYLNKLAGAVTLQTKVLLELVKKFDHFYGQAKRALNCLDFADLEHYAIKLLTDEKSSEDEPTPSETALALRKRYRYIFVDEYQDINDVQKTILDMLSAGPAPYGARAGGNVFVVGDVKQSIYQWRGARPEIFLDRLKQASPEPTDTLHPLCVPLNENWRSTKGILDFVNEVFGQIMTGSFAKIDYDQSAMLQPGSQRQLNKSPTAPVQPAVELHILDEERPQSSEDDDADKADGAQNMGFDSRQRQAALIAQRIKRMVGADTGQAEFEIYDKAADKYRPVVYGDIVILMRSLAGKADFIEVLQLAGVPISSAGTAGYFETTEITDMLCLLKVLDNPRRDIELAAILRSPLFGVRDADLANIRLYGRTGDNRRGFYDCAAVYSVRNDKLAGRLKDILGQIEEWRTIARRGNLADLIWKIYRLTGYLSFVCAMPNGRARRANLLKLHERAIQFEGFISSRPVPSLTRFIEFVEKLQQTGQDWSPAEPQTAAGDTVRVLSIHKSKGLEFPVVFLADVNSEFSKADTRVDCLVDEKCGLGLRIIDRDANAKLDSVAYQVIAEQKQYDSLAEEMRILYVAVTRAKDRLILVGSENHGHCRDLISSAVFFRDNRTPDWQLRRCKSHLDWILLGLAGQKRLQDAFNTGLEADAADRNLFSASPYDRPELDNLSRYIQGLKAGKSKHPPVAVDKPKSAQTPSMYFSAVKQSLDWRYPFSNQTRLPAKSSVTQWTHRNDEYRRLDYSQAIRRKPKAVSTAGPGDARLLGTAAHLVMSRVDLSRPVTRECVKKVIDDLVSADAITPVLASRINPESIVRFFESVPGKLAADKSNIILREWPFTFSIPSSEFSRTSHEGRVTSHEPRLSRAESRGVTSHEFIIVQGIIDMLIQTPKGLLVVDFKTDHVSAEQSAQRAEMYKPQLGLYARSAEAILKTNITGKWLYFLTPGCTIKV